MNRRLCLKLALALGAGAGACAGARAGGGTGDATGPQRGQVLVAIALANGYWQGHHAPQQRPFWDEAAYHTGNMAAYALTRNEAWLAYSTAWAEHNHWRGAGADDRSAWKSTYGETPDHVLFGDWQCCFQTYIDLYELDGRRHPQRIARVREVMDYEMSTPNSDYWWWADGLYMAMPVMTRLYKVTGERRYLDKLQEYFAWADRLMYDREAGLYYRDAKYVYPAHRSASGGKDFWARGDGWVFAAFARVLADLPPEHPLHRVLAERYRRMAASLAPIQQAEGYWTRSLLDPGQAPGPESSGTAFFTFGYLWGLNNGYFKAADYEAVALRGWRFLSETALQADGQVGYVQPIGERAIPGQLVDRHSTAPFGVGAFLLAGCEMAAYLDKRA